MGILASNLSKFEENHIIDDCKSLQLYDIHDNIAYSWMHNPYNAKEEDIKKLQYYGITKLAVQQSFSLTWQYWIPRDPDLDWNMLQTNCEVLIIVDGGSEPPKNFRCDISNAWGILLKLQGADIRCDFIDHKSPLSFYPQILKQIHPKYIEFSEGRIEDLQFLYNTNQEELANIDLTLFVEEDQNWYWVILSRHKCLDSQIRFMDRWIGSTQPIEGVTKHSLIYLKHILEHNK